MIRIALPVGLALVAMASSTLAEPAASFPDVAVEQQSGVPGAPSSGALPVVSSPTPGSGSTTSPSRQDAPPGVEASAAARAAAEPPLPGFQLDVRAALGVGLSGFYGLGQIDAGYRALPFLLVGASLDHTFAANQGNDSCYEAGYDCPGDYFAFGPRVELQPLPSWVVGPWIGAELGLIVFEGQHVSPRDFRSLALEATLDVGIEARATRGFAFGVYAAGKQCLTDPYAPAADRNETYLVSAGFRVAGRF